MRPLPGTLWPPQPSSGEGFHEFTRRLVRLAEQGVMQLEATEQGGILVARLSGRLDVNTAPNFSEAFQKFESLPTVLDMGELEYLSSAGLRALHIAAKGCPKLVVANFTGFCKEIYEVSGFSAIVPEYTTVAEAVEALR